MERTELAQYYMRVMQEDEKVEKLRVLKSRKKELKQRMKAVNNYMQMLEVQLESVLDRIDYIEIFE
jgi:peroxiredoxin family protein